MLNRYTWEQGFYFWLRLEKLSQSAAKHTAFTFFLISVKMDLESKSIGFQLEPERSVSSHEGFYHNSSDKGNTTERNIFVRKDCDLSVWWKCRNCSTMKTEKECLCYQEVEAVCDFNIQGIFVLSEAIILSE